MKLLFVIAFLLSGCASKPKLMRDCKPAQNGFSTCFDV